MGTCRFMGTSVLTRLFEKNGVCYQKETCSKYETLTSAITVESGRTVEVRCMAYDDNGVLLFIPRFVQGIPQRRLPRVLEACDRLNREHRQFKVYLDCDRTALNIEYCMILPSNDPADGAVEFELFVLLPEILGEAYGRIAEETEEGPKDCRLRPLKSAPDCETFGLCTDENEYERGLRDEARLPYRLWGDPWEDGY